MEPPRRDIFIRKLTQYCDDNKSCHLQKGYFFSIETIILLHLDKLWYLLLFLASED